MVPRLVVSIIITGLRRLVSIAMFRRCSGRGGSSGVEGVIDVTATSLLH
jgi:hypothetical protein